MFSRCSASPRQPLPWSQLFSEKVLVYSTLLLNRFPELFPPQPHSRPVSALGGPFIDSAPSSSPIPSVAPYASPPHRSLLSRPSSNSSSLTQVLFPYPPPELMARNVYFPPLFPHNPWCCCSLLSITLRFLPPRLRESGEMGVPPFSDLNRLGPLLAQNFPGPPMWASCGLFWMNPAGS